MCDNPFSYDHSGSLWLLILLSFFSLFSGCQSRPEQPERLITKIAFGSCGHQDLPQFIYDVVLNHNPDLFVFLGDNIYGDTHVPDTLRLKYARLADKPEFLRLMSKTKVLATWDDHDYGWNDSGRHYPEKEISKSIFLDFWNVPAESPRRARPGIYESYYYEYGAKVLQLILLDNRTFRDDLRRYDSTVETTRDFFYQLDYLPHISPDSTLLGKAQWPWLKEQLLRPADIRIIASSTQFGIEFNGYEAWANFPHEQQRMLDLIKETKANGVMFISGDVHYGEISVMRKEDLYPIYDVTSSGITSTWDFATPNANRIEGPVMDNHFGLLTISWSEDPVITMEIIDIRDNQRVEYSIKLSEISFKIGEGINGSTRKGTREEWTNSQ